MYPRWHPGRLSSIGLEPDARRNRARHALHRKVGAILHGVPVTAQNADLFVPHTETAERPVNETEASRQIAALKAIVQTMLPDHYPRTHGQDGKTLFAEQLAEDELLAMAVANELSENEFEHAFGWIDASYGTIENELAASPWLLHPELTEDAATSMGNADGTVWYQVDMPEGSPGRVAQVRYQFDGTGLRSLDIREKSGTLHQVSVEDRTGAKGGSRVRPNATRQI